MKPELRAVPEGIELSWTFRDQTRMVPLTWDEAAQVAIEILGYVEAYEAARRIETEDVELEA